MFPRPPLLIGHPGDGRLIESNDDYGTDEKWMKIVGNGKKLTIEN